RDQQAETGIECQQLAQLLRSADAAPAAAACTVPTPLAADTPVQQLVGDGVLIAELLAGIADEKAAEALQEAVEIRIVGLAVVGLRKGIGQHAGAVVGAGDARRLTTAMAKI